MITVTAFCNQNAAQANQPGPSSIGIRLVAIPGAQGPNANVFVGGNGNGFFELQNVTPEIAAQLAAGQSYTITIEPIAPPS